MVRPSSRLLHFAAVAVAAGALVPAAAQACTPERLREGAHGRDLCWGDQTWTSDFNDDALVEQTFDFYRSTSKSMAPLIMYFHPSGTTSHIAQGSLAHATLLQPALDAGYAFASIEYRHPVADDDVDNGPKDPRVPHWDAARATQFLRANANALGIDKRQVFFVGHSRGSIALWTALQPDMADPSSEDPVARESTRELAVFMYQAQTTYRDREFASLFLVPQDRAGFEADYEAEHPKWREFGSAIASADATSPPVKQRFRDTYPGHLITEAEMETEFEDAHYPGYGAKLCQAYRRVNALADCVVEYAWQAEHAFDGYLDFFAAYRPALTSRATRPRRRPFRSA